MPPIQYSLILFYIIITKLSRECEIFFYQIAHISHEMALSGKQIVFGEVFGVYAHGKYAAAGFFI